MGTDANRKVKFTLTGDATGAKKAFGHVDKGASNSSKALKKFGAMGKVAMVGVGAAAVKGVFELGSFDKKVREVGTLLGDVSDNQIKQLGVDIRDVAKEFGQEAPNVAKAFYDSISAGVANADTAKDFAADAAKFASAGATDISTGVDVLTSAINAYGLTAGDAGKVSDTLFATVRAGKTTVSELAAGFSTVGPVASTAGLSLEEVMGWVAQLTLSGTPTAQAMTQVRSALAELLNPAKKLSKNFQEVAGKTFVEFIDAGGDVQGAMQLMQQHSEDTGKGMTEMSSRIEGAMALLGATGGNAERFSATLASVADSAGATDTAFAVMKDGVGFTIDQLKAKFADFKLTLGAFLVPLMEGIAWLVSNKTAMLAIGGVLAAMFATWAAGALKAAVATAAATGGLTLIIPAVLAVGAAIYVFRDKVASALGAAYGAVTSFVAATLETLAGWAGHVGTAIGHALQHFEGLYTGVRWVLDKLGKDIPAWSDVVAVGVTAVEGTLRAAAAAIREHGEGVSRTLQGTAGVVAAATTSAASDFRVLRANVTDDMESVREVVETATDATSIAVGRATENTIRNTRSQTAAAARMWEGLADAHRDANRRMMAASAARRAAALDDLARELDATCSATQAMSECQQRLAADWNLYGGQMVDDTTYFVGSWQHTIDEWTSKFADSGARVESTFARVSTAAHTTATDVRHAAQSMADSLALPLEELDRGLREWRQTPKLISDVREETRRALAPHGPAMDGLPAYIGAGNIRSLHAGGTFLPPREQQQGLALLRRGEVVMAPGAGAAREGGGVLHVTVQMDGRTLVEALERYSHQVDAVDIVVA